MSSLQDFSPKTPTQYLCVAAGFLSEEVKSSLQEFSPKTPTLSLCLLCKTSRRRRQHYPSLSSRRRCQHYVRICFLCRASRRRRQPLCLLAKNANTTYVFLIFAWLFVEDVNTVYAFVFFAGLLAEDDNPIFLFVFSPKTPVNRYFILCLLTAR